jgi:hypothetical protein
LTARSPSWRHVFVVKLVGNGKGAPVGVVVIVVVVIVVVASPMVGGFGDVGEN